MRNDTQRASEEDSLGIVLTTVVLIFVMIYGHMVLMGGSFGLNLAVLVVVVLVGPPAFAEARAEFLSWKASRNLDSELRELDGARN